MRFPLCSACFLPAASPAEFLLVHLKLSPTITTTTAHLLEPCWGPEAWWFIWGAWQADQGPAEVSMPWQQSDLHEDSKDMMGWPWRERTEPTNQKRGGSTAQQYTRSSKYDILMVPLVAWWKVACNEKFDTFSNNYKSWKQGECHEQRCFHSSQISFQDQSLAKFDQIVWLQSDFTFWRESPAPQSSAVPLLLPCSRVISYAIAPIS